MLRNFISVTGITQESKLPKEIKDALLCHSDIDYIFIPSSRPKIKEITHIAVRVELKNQRIIKAPTGTIVVLDGLKKLKISYVPLGHSRKNIQLEIDVPYNTFIELPDGVENLNNLDIYIADAYFEVVEVRKIYNYTLYMINIDCSEKSGAPETEPEESLEEKDEAKEPSQDFLSSLKEALFPYVEVDDFEDNNDEFEKEEMEKEDYEEDISDEDNREA